MKQVVEAYAGLWVIMFLFLLAMAFTSINLHVAQARRIMDSIKAEVQASNGQYVNNVEIPYDVPLKIEDKTHLDNAYMYSCVIERTSPIDKNINDADETYIYGDVFKISLKYTYWVPLFGKQIYPIEVFAY